MQQTPTPDGPAPASALSRDDLVRTVETLREALRARDDFLAVAAHELRNPMHALLLHVGRALDRARRGGDRDLIQRLERMSIVVDRYVRRATTLLDISRINSGRLGLHLEDVDLREVVQTVVEAYAPEIAFSGVTLQVDAPESLRGRWDRQALDQITSNLISNAIKYGNAKPVTITLRRDGPMATLEVRDNGIGISAADQARIFERFERVVPTRPQPGFGIGLWVVRALVDAHGGSIAVASVPGQGSRFTVRLPLDPPPSIPLETT